MFSISITTITYFAAGRDFIASSGVLTFGPGVTEKTIEVTVINDNVYEGLQEFSAELSTNEMQVNIFQTDAMAQIIDDDGKLISAVCYISVVMQATVCGVDVIEPDLRFSTARGSKPDKMCCKN